MRLSGGFILAVAVLVFLSACSRVDNGIIDGRSDIIVNVSNDTQKTEFSGNIQKADVKQNNSLVDDREYLLNEDEPLQNLYVHFIDLGDGDATYIDFWKHNVLVDCGGEEDRKRVVEYLDQQGIVFIDLLIVTHPHDDSVGGCAYVMKNFRVKEVWEGPAIISTRGYTNFVKERNRVGNYRIVEPGYRRQLDDLLIEVKSAKRPALGQYTDINDNSVVLRLSFGNVKILLAADCQNECEENIEEDIGADVLRVSYQGSNLGTTDKFLDRVNPKTAIISVGDNNPHQNPRKEVLSRLFERNIEVYRTNTDGNIVLQANSEGYFVRAEGK